MQNFSILKQEFLRNWIEGLQVCNVSSSKMGILEKKKAIKLSADLAMAFTRKGRTSWSRAVIAKATNRNNNKYTDNGLNAKASKQRLIRSKKIMKRSRKVTRIKSSAHESLKAPPVSMAKRLVRKRTQALRRLLPGGDQCVDEVSLMRETLDYMVSLIAQVDVMRSCLARATTKLDVNDKVVNGS